MTVSELIKILSKHNQDMKVAYSLFSEYVLMENNEVEVKELVKPRPDGWVQNYRPDMETELYVVFPGN